MTTWWAFFISAQLVTWLGAHEKVQIMVGGETAEECQEARELVQAHGPKAALLGPVVVRRMTLTECVPVGLELAEGEEDKE